MILVDTSVWIDHLREGDGSLRRLLEDANVITHPWVIGEVALGNLSSRQEVLGLLANLPSAEVATAQEVARLIEDEHLHGRGIGYVDAHLLAATRLTPDTRLWTRDRRLSEVAGRLELRAEPGPPAP